MIKYVNLIIIVLLSSQPFVSSFDLRIKYFRSDEEANGTRFYALDFLGLIEKHGREVEWHNITTDDGYILSLFRIPPNPKLYNRTQKSRAIYLQHGLLGTADIFIIFGPGRSLDLHKTVIKYLFNLSIFVPLLSSAYSLSDAGYDVWIGNVRGNHYSRRHIKYSTDDSEFWDFSMDEYALQDFPAFFDYILKTTGQPQLSYIGHSLGSTLILMLLADKPEYNSKLEVVVHFAAVSYWKTWNLTRLLIGSASLLLQVFVPGGAIEFPIQTVIVPASVYYFCLINEITKRLCGLLVRVSVGEDREQFDISEEAVYVLCHYPAGCSAKVSQHYGQQLRSGNFAHYQYGRIVSNREAYGQDKAPEYNLSSITTPTIIFAGQNDPIATLENSENLINKLPQDLELVYKVIEYEKFTHGDFVNARDVEKLLYKPMLKILEDFYESKETGSDS